MLFVRPAPAIIVAMPAPGRDELSSRFESAIYEVWFDDGPRRFTVGGDSDSCDEPFALVTGYNPGGHDTPDTVNDASNAMLEIELQGRAIRYRLGNGHDPAWTHDEPSFALFGLSRDRALAIASRFGQAALFWWDGKQGSILWT